MTGSSGMWSCRATRKQSSSTTEPNPPFRIMTGLLDPLFRTSAMCEIFSDRGRLQGMLDFEAALARAEARLGAIPKSAAQLIATPCRAELYDIGLLAHPSAPPGNTSMPLLHALPIAV